VGKKRTCLGFNRAFRGTLPRRVAGGMLTALATLASLLTVWVGQVGAAEANPAIHFVVDVSGSMAGERLASAVDAIKQSAAAVPNTTALGLRSYAGNCDQSSVPPLVPIGIDNDAAISAAADTLVAGGGTPTTAALGQGFQELQAYPTTGAKRLVLLTDGDTQCGISICDFVKQNLPAGLQLQLYAVGLQVSSAAAGDLTCAAQATGGEYIPARQPSDLVDALTQATGGRSCRLEGAGGWRFRAHVSPNDGLVLDESSFKDRIFTEQVSVPYLEGIYQYGKSRGLVSKIELTPTRDQAHASLPVEPIVGSTLVPDSFKCEATDTDIYVKAVYVVDDFVAETATPGPLTVTQEYRFRGVDPAHPCEPTEKLTCGRFWPSLYYSYAGDPACSPDKSPTCGKFTLLRTVQRLAFRPDGAPNGGIDAYRDSPNVNRDPGIINTKGSGGSMKYEDADEAIRNGKRGDWDSLHQSPTSVTSGPGVLSPGCGECVHMHWAWALGVNVVSGVRGRFWTDGKPEILDGSSQSADFGVARLIDTDAERDPVVDGWRSLIDEKESEASQLRGYTPVVFWEMSSSSNSDAAFPVLDNYDHGGNGAIFFGE
jgi:hypothetical protein